MAKKGSRLREFEMNHRVLDISTAQEARKKKKEKKKNLPEGKNAAAAAYDDAGAKTTGKSAGKSAGGRGGLVRLIGMAIVVIFILMVVMSIKNIFDLKEEERELMKKNEALLQLKEELLMELDNVNSDEYIEEQARKELNLVKGNELVFFFPDDWNAQAAKKEAAEAGKEAEKEKDE